MTEQKPFFLITNDDGVHAPGIRHLNQQLKSLGRVMMMAPHVERSASSHAISIHSPLRKENVGEDAYGIEGTPADCVFLALHELAPTQPDWIVSGINRGGNLGTDTLYSGTVAAAVEGHIRGLKAMAVSCHSIKDSKHNNPQDEHYEYAAQIVSKLIQNPHIEEAASSCVINVNIPNIPPSQIQGVAICKLGVRSYDDSMKKGVDPRGRPYYWIGGGGHEFEDIQGTDCERIDKGFITLSCLKPCFDALETFETLKGSFQQDMIGL